MTVDLYSTIYISIEAHLDTLIHQPVLSKEIIEAFDPQPKQQFVDGTLGGAGHTRLLLERGVSVIGIDQDPYALGRVRAENLSGLTLVEGNFRDMDALLPEHVGNIDGVLLDIGVSSFQLDDAQRGFSYHESAPLDMRMSRSGESAHNVINELEADELAAILFEFGEERHSRRIARAIVEARTKQPIETTVELAAIIKSAYPGGHARGIHPARRSFQALRIYVNDELGALKDGLNAATRLLKPGGKLAVISFHSLEDRIVKHYFRDHLEMTSMHKRPLQASLEEQAENPRSRSAKLRVGVRT